jgi:hypothetical protein
MVIFFVEMMAGLVFVGLLPEPGMSEPGMLGPLMFELGVFELGARAA